MGLMKNIAMSRGGRGFAFMVSPSDLARFQDKLKGIDNDLQKKIISKALRSGGKIFIQAAKTRVQSDRVEAGIRGTLRTVRGIKGYIAGASQTLPNPAWLEYGTMDKYTGSGRGGKSYRIKRTKRLKGADGNWYTLPEGREMTRGQRPRPFLRPSFNEKYPAMINKMADTIGKELLKHGR